ncbi:RidA family protein [Agaribacter flavus]|uniref:RidA family protein n=1 Tax=Agaribacter flavus TaxID=1902781 RepID=A0ABV7FNL9_9ALTE
MKIIKLLSVLTTYLLISANVNAEVTRHKLPNNSTFPIARAVEVPATTTLIYHSGQVPSPANPDAEKYSMEYWGDTEAQTLSVLKKFESSFKDLGVDFGDAVKLTVFLVGDPNLDGKMDFAGFMRAYTKYFGTKEQPNLPARSALQVAGLVAPNMLVEIEMVLAKPSK